MIDLQRDDATQRHLTHIYRFQQNSEVKILRQHFIIINSHKDAKLG